MSIQSMTGFGRGESQNENFSFTVDVKSVNHRFKDTRFKMSSLFAPLEIELKKLLGSKFKRGSFDIFVNYKKSQIADKKIELDQEKIANFISQIQETTEKLDVDMEFSPTDFLRQEFYLERDQKVEEEMHALMKVAFEAALKNLEASRIGEGEKLKEVLKNHKELYQKQFDIVCQKLPEFQTHVEEKLKKKFLENKEDISIDEPRFMQEVVYYLEKLDVSEEINRIKIHLEKLEKILSQKNEIGRQIDFLVQELGRETNTIGSKSSMSEISDAVVQMKVQLEKIREQGLNLE